MKLLLTLSLLLAASWTWAATTFPASTNGNNTFFGVNTFTQPTYSASPTTNGPSAAEFATAGWVRGLFSNGVIDYTTTNIDNTATNPGTAGQPVYTFSTTIPPSDVRVYTAPNAGDYLGSVITTNRFTFIQGPIDVSAYLAGQGGLGAPSISIHPELYYTYDKSNLLGDWVAANQLITIGTTNLYQWVISFPNITATNADGFYLERRFKVGAAAGATHPNLRVLIGTNGVSGTNDGSHIDFAGPSSQIGSANLNNNQTFTGTNTFTNVTIFEGDTIFNTIIRGKVYMTNSVLFTNSMQQTINFGTNISYSEGVFQTNAAFAWLGFEGISGNIAQTAVVWLTNTTGAVWDFTVPANCHTKGILNCTNVSELVFKCYGNKWTNLLSLPLW